LASDSKILIFTSKGKSDHIFLLGGQNKANKSNRQVESLLLQLGDVLELYKERRRGGGCMDKRGAVAI
jgi:hypothetical protein